MPKFNMNLSGLTDSEVIESRSANGSNVLTPPTKTPLWKRFLEKFKDPLIIILLVAGILSIGISCYEYWGLGLGRSVFFEPVGIIIAILLATGLAFYFEIKADREFSLLNQVNDDEPVQVVRNGNITEIPKRDVVVGDIVLINTGDEIPADGKLISATSLTVDESTLTGEPACPKTTKEEDFDPDATFPSDEVMRGTRVLEGHGIYRVTAVGDHTENGKVFVASQIDNSVKTPLNEQLEKLGHIITIGSYVIASAIVAGRILMYFINADFEWIGFLTYILQTLMIAVTLVVVSVPEGLPMAVTLSLAYSMRRMLKTSNLVRRMHACETLGATTVICTDKTGTLTQNRMQVDDVFFPELTGENLGDSPYGRLLAEGIAVNSTAQLDLSDSSRPKALGNPTEGALLLWLHDNGIDYQAERSLHETVSELPFSTERKFMATVVRDKNGGETLFVKGAPEIVASLCSKLPTGMTTATLDSKLLAYQNRAMRTLGFAYKRLAPGEKLISDNGLSVTDLEFMGVTAISDPVRSDVPAAVDEVLNAGIKIKIVTGDTPATAKEIGRQIGLWTDSDTDNELTTGAEFAALTDEELRDRVESLKIIARARPMDKKRLVEALQANNEVVAVTGDGTNDAPALKAAQVGLSMGDGTAVAKEASDITIVDNSFASIGRGVMWGRSLYLNIQRFVLFQLTVNVAACLIVLAGAFIGMESPLTVTQMLWVNLIMDTFAATALASLPPTKSVMNDSPRDRKAFIITRGMRRDIIGTGGIFFIMLLALLYVFEHVEINSLGDLFPIHLGRYNGLTPYELSLFFTTFVFLQFWNMFNARAYATGRSALHLRGCGEFTTIALLILFGQIAIVELGGEFFNVTPLSLSDWAMIIASTSIVLWIGEILRMIRRRHKNRSLQPKKK